MDTGRLKSVLSDIVAETAAQNLQSLTAAVVANLQNAVNVPNGPHETGFKDALTLLFANLETTPSNYWTPSRRQVLVATGIAPYVGTGLRESIDQILKGDGLLRAAILQQIQLLAAEQQKKLGEAVQLVSAMSLLGLQEMELPKTGVEIGYLLPDSIDTKNLKAIEKELKHIDRMLLTLAELYGEPVASSTVRELHSGSLTVFLWVANKVANALLDIVERILGIWQTTIDLRKQEAELKKNGVPEAAIEPIRLHIETMAATEISAYVNELLNRPDIARHEDGRKNEIRNSLSISIKLLATKIDAGAKVEASVLLEQSPEADGQGQTVASETELAKTIKNKGALMRATPTLDHPILAIQVDNLVDEDNNDSGTDKNKVP